MIDSLLNLLFRCPHRRLTRPVAPITKPGQPPSDSYVVCLDCGKQFQYDVNTMRMGKAIDRSHEVGVLPPNMPEPRKRNIKYAMLAVVPVAVLLGTVWKRKNPAAAPEAKKPDAGTPTPSGKQGP